MDLVYQIRNKHTGKREASFDRERKAISFLQKEKTNIYDVYITNSLSGAVRCIMSGQRLVDDNISNHEVKCEEMLLLKFE